MLRFYFSKIGMAIAGETGRDKEYARMRRQYAAHDLLQELQNNLPKKGFSVRHYPMDEKGRMTLYVSENRKPNLVFLFTLHAECSELLEMTGCKAAFQVESAATRKTEIFYAGHPDKPKTGMAEFLICPALNFGKKQA